jgi:murein DD-endopeptidase MepM/ murein hydrolase activator NlpD
MPTEDPKSFSVIIVPSDHSRTRQFRVSQTMVFVGAGLLLTLTAIFVTFAATHLNVLKTARNVNSLEAENLQLREDVARIDDLARQLEVLSAQRAQIYNMLGGEELEAGGEFAMPMDEAVPEAEPLGDTESIERIIADGARLSFAPRSWPTTGRVRREFQPEAEGGSSAHPGLSLEVLALEPARAAGRGRVLESGLSESGEPRLVLDHGYGFRTVYAGFARPMVSVGQIVERQQAIAEFDESGSPSGNRAGRITGPTLYFEIRVDGLAIDPRNYLTPRQGRRRGS